MEKIINFLTEIRTNNNREWFAKHKTEYKEAEKEFLIFAEHLIEGIASFDPTVKNLSARDCTYRIYRDIRFSADKSPYKTHAGVYICPGGKKSGNAGYYFHIEPAGKGLLGHHLLTTGLYMPEREFLNSVREDILFKGEDFLATIKQAEGFILDMEESLKRIPSGFPSDSPYADYLKLKNICLVKHLTNEDILATDLLQKSVADFKRTLAFNNFLNRAIQYAREEKG